MKTFFLAILSAAILWVIGSTACGAIDPAVAQATKRIRPEAIRAHIEFLADDLLEGRGTGSRGHKLAVNYIRAQCETFGLPHTTSNYGRDLEALLEYCAAQGIAAWDGLDPQHVRSFARSATGAGSRRGASSAAFRPPGACSAT